MGTDARIHDISHLTRGELEDIAGHDYNRNWNDWQKSYVKACMGDEFEVGEDDGGFKSDFRVVVENAIGYEGIHFLSDRIQTQILIRILHFYEVDKDLKIFVDWETQWDNPDVKDVIDLVKWMREHSNHWIFLTC